MSLGLLLTQLRERNTCENCGQWYCFSDFTFSSRPRVSNCGHTVCEQCLVGKQHSLSDLINANVPSDVIPDNAPNDTETIHTPCPLCPGVTVKHDWTVCTQLIRLLALTGEAIDVLNKSEKENKRLQAVVEGKLSSKERWLVDEIRELWKRKQELKKKKLAVRKDEEQLVRKQQKFSLLESAQAAETIALSVYQKELVDKQKAFENAWMERLMSSEQTAEQLFEDNQRAADAKAKLQRDVTRLEKEKRMLEHTYADVMASQKYEREEMYKKNMRLKGQLEKEKSKVQKETANLEQQKSALEQDYANWKAVHNHEKDQLNERIRVLESQLEKEKIEKESESTPSASPKLSISTDCGQCGVKDKLERLYICMGCPKGQRGGEKEIAPFVLCGHCTLGDHQGHNVVKYGEEVRRLITVAVGANEDFVDSLEIAFVALMEKESDVFKEWVKDSGSVEKFNFDELTYGDALEICASLASERETVKEAVQKSYDEFIKQQNEQKKKENKKSSKRGTKRKSV